MNTYDYKEKIKELNMARAYGYMFLKRAFYIEPTMEYISALSKDEYLESFPFRDENNNINKGLEEVELYLSQKDITSEEEYNKIHWDYTRMFIGPRELPAPPWESSYLNEDKLLFQEETLQVRRSYLKYNFIPENYPYEADDHIALELDFMYRLSVKLDEAMEEEEGGKIVEILQDKKNFLEYHLRKWVPIFAKKINENAETNYYKGISKILDGFLEIDYEIILELIDKFS